MNALSVFVFEDETSQAMENKEKEHHFLHQFQSILFSSQLENGSAAEKADVLRRALVELKLANKNNV